MGKPVTVDSSNFDKIVVQSKIPVLVDFWAPWCGPCRMVAPVVEELATEYEGKVIFGKVNVDDEREVAGKFGIMSIPTLIIFKDGKPLSNLVGFRPKAELKQSLDAALGK
ncbi:MAG: thioredoxin [Dehalococcoidales bacterium]|nr:thioredoxin [Dehalococcoidales bacterium]